jgi:hypothetical protein
MGLGDDWYKGSQGSAGQGVAATVEVRELLAVSVNEDVFVEDDLRRSKGLWVDGSKVGLAG